MGIDIHAISQTADDEQFWTKRPEVLHQPPNKVLPINSAPSCAHHTDHTRRIEVGRTLIKEHQRRIVTLFESLRIARVGHTERFNAVAGIIFQFGFSEAQMPIDCFHRLDKPWRGIG